MKHVPRAFRRGHILFVALAALLLLLAACGSSGGDGPGGGEVVAGVPGQLAGIGSYDIAETDDGFQVAVFDLDGKRVGNVSIVPDFGDWIGSFEPADGSGQAGTLEVMAWLAEEGDRVGVTYRITADEPTAPGGLVTMQAMVTWSYDPTAVGSGPDDWTLERIALETPLAPDAPPPGIGGLIPQGDATMARLLIFDQLAGDATAAEVVAWLTALDLEAMIDNQPANVLMALFHDGALTSTLIDHMGERSEAQTNNKSADGASEGTGSDFDPEKNVLTASCGVENLSKLTRQYVVGCGMQSVPGAGLREACGVEGDVDEQVPIEDRLASMFDFFISDRCQQAHLVCGLVAAKFSECMTALTEGEWLERCQTEYRRCPDGTKPWNLRVFQYEYCECLCGTDSCSAWCADHLAARGLTPYGDSRCGDPFECVCSFDADQYCSTEFGIFYCGGGELDTVSRSCTCNTAYCGDGAFTPSCALNPERNEECDDTAPNGEGRCSDGFECVDCHCVPSDTPIDPKPNACDPDQVDQYPTEAPVLPSSTCPARFVTTFNDPELGPQAIPFNLVEVPERTPLFHGWREGFSFTCNLHRENSLSGGITLKVYWQPCDPGAWGFEFEDYYRWRSTPWVACVEPGQTYFDDEEYFGSNLVRVHSGTRMAVALGNIATPDFAPEDWPDLHDDLLDATQDWLNANEHLGYACPP
ncbi:MAG: hypothetical protein JW797_18760 [Bradymonadales bacterium]|nr:hypothetical protein [Bradymonadales bacterium]